MKPRCSTVWRVAALIAALLAAGPARAASDNWLNVDCDIGWQGCYRPTDWVPIDLGILADIKDPFECAITITGDQDEQTAMTVARRFVLTPKERTNLPLVVRLAGGSDCDVSIQDKDERPVWKQTYHAYDAQAATRVRQPLGAGDMLIGVIGRMDFGLRQLGQAAHAEAVTSISKSPAIPAYGGPVGPTYVAARPYNPASSGADVGAVYVKEKLQPRMPWDWAAYECLDLLVLYDPDWAAMKPDQSAAIVQWVMGGGRLLVILGTHPLPADNPVAKLLPVTLGAARKVALPGRIVRGWDCDDSEEALRAVTAWSLEDVKAWGWTSEDYGTGDPLFAWGPAGFGKAALLAFDPSALHLRGAASPVDFWMQQTRSLAPQHSLAPGADTNMNNSGGGNYPGSNYGGGNYGRSEMTASGEAVLNYLLDIPQMQPISILWIILLLMGLAAVIGPVDYFVLKRLDRLPLTWLTFTCYIVVFSVVAYYGVGALRSGQAQVRTVSVVDAVSGQDGAWSSSYSGIFAPESDDYKLSGLGRGQWWSSFSPYTEDPSSYYNQRSASRRMTCTQEDGSSLPTYLPINIWSMQCLLQESAVAEMPIAAKVERDGDSIHASVENLSDAAVTRGWIAVGGGRIVQFGPVGPKQTIQVTGRLGVGSSPRQAPGGPMPGSPYGDEDEVDAPSAAPLQYMANSPAPREVLGACGSRGTIKRTRAIEEALAQGAVVVCAQFDPPPVGFGLADRECRVTHVGLARLVVVPGKGGAK